MLTSADQMTEPDKVTGTLTADNMEEVWVPRVPFEVGATVLTYRACASRVVLGFNRIVNTHITQENGELAVVWKTKEGLKIRHLWMFLPKELQSTHERQSKK